MNTKELEIYRRRLNHLKVQAAMQGISTPPEILIEIEDITDIITQYSDREIAGNLSPANQHLSSLGISNLHNQKYPNENSTNLPKNNTLLQSPKPTIESDSAFGNKSTSRRKELRLLRVEHKYRKDIRRRRAVLGAIPFVIGLFLLIPSVYASSIGDKVFFFLFGIVPFSIGVLVFFKEYISRHRNIVIFPDHFEYRKYDDAKTISWDEIEYIQYVTKWSSMWDERQDTYIIKSVNGIEIRINYEFEKLEDLILSIQRNVLKELLPIAVNVYNSGQPLIFGPYSIDGQGINIDMETIYWNQIESLRLDDKFWIKTFGDDEEYSIGVIEFIPNVFMYKRFIYHLYSINNEQ